MVVTKSIDCRTKHLLNSPLSQLTGNFSAGLVQTAA